MNNQQRPEIKLVGISARTNNEAEMDPARGKIGPTIHQYDHEKIADKILNKTHPGVTYCVYTDYADNHFGDYTYFVGEEVDSFDNLPEGLVTLTIPAQKYTVFTNEPGPMPQVCINMWMQIWSDPDLTAKRAYLADFEIYDRRARDPKSTVLDIYLGVL
jgi:predicted transcriptional regulator YdeE